MTPSLLPLRISLGSQESVSTCPRPPIQDSDVPTVSTAKSSQDKPPCLPCACTAGPSKLLLAVNLAVKTQDPHVTAYLMRSVEGDHSLYNDQSVGASPWSDPLVSAINLTPVSVPDWSEIGISHDMAQVPHEVNAVVASIRQRDSDSAV